MGIKNYQRKINIIKVVTDVEKSFQRATIKHKEVSIILHKVFLVWGEVFIRSVGLVGDSLKVDLVSV